jgi:hypothetical protein
VTVAHVDAIASRDCDLARAGRDQGRGGVDGDEVGGVLFNRNVAYHTSAAVALRAHQTQEFGGVNLANIAEKLGYSDYQTLAQSPSDTPRSASGPTVPFSLSL